jgi:hypothetical protein
LRDIGVADAVMLDAGVEREQINPWASLRYPSSPDGIGGSTVHLD